MRPKEMLFILFIVFNNLKAQNAPVDFGFKAYQIVDENLDTIKFYVSAKDINKRRPIIVYLDGSGPYPLFYKSDPSKKGYSSTVCLPVKKIQNKYHVVLISKPSIPFFQILEEDSTGRPMITPSKKYDSLLSLDYRANSASRVIDFLVRQNWVDTTKIVVWGVSEGAQVAPRVAVINKKVTHIICFSGTGVNQFYGFMINIRNDVEAGNVSHQEGQAKIDTLIEIFKDIYKNPEAIDKSWEGHTYLRWASFCQESPFDNFMKLDIPIYIAKGTADINSPILSTDYIHLEFIKNNKKNLTYVVYPGYDHFFNEKKTVDGKETELIYHTGEVVEDALKWLENN